MRMFAAVAAALCLSTLAVAGPREGARTAPQPIALPVAQDVIDLRFPSGLRVVLQPVPDTGVVGLTSVVDAGSGRDPKGKEGTAHLLEHLWLRIHEEGKPPVLDQLDQRGCDYAGSTSVDDTSFRMVCGADHLETMVAIEGLRLGAPLSEIRAEDIEVEREVLRSEHRYRTDLSGRGLLPYLYNHLYDPEHPYAASGLTSHDALDNIGLADIATFAASRYRAEHTTLAIAGDFAPSAAIELLFAHFPLSVFADGLTVEHMKKTAAFGVDAPREEVDGDWMPWPVDPADPSKPLTHEAAIAVRLPPEAPEPASPHNTEIGHYRAPVDWPTVVVGWTLPAGYRGDDRAMRLIPTFLEQAIYDVTSLRQVLDADCTVWPHVLDTKLICRITMPQGAEDFELVRRKLFSNLAGDWRDTAAGTVNDWIKDDRALARDLRGHLRALDRLSSPYSGRATRLAKHAHYRGSPQAFLDDWKEREAFEGRRVREILERHVKKSRASVLFLEPLTEEELTEQVRPDAHSKSAPSLPSSSPLATPAAIAAAEPFDLDDLEVRTLPTGLTVAVLPTHTAPMVQMRLVFRNLPDMDEQGLLRERTSFKLESLVRYGGYRSRDTLGETADIDIQVPVENADGGLWHLRDSMGNLLIVEGRDKRDWASQAAERLSPYESAEWTLWRALSEDDASRPWLPYNPALNPLPTVGPPWINDRLGQIYRPGNGVLLIVGDLDAEEAFALVDKHFGDWGPFRGDGPPLPDPPAWEAPEGDRIFVLDDVRRWQTSIRARCQLDATSEDFWAVQAVEAAVHARVFDVIRDERGMAYSVGASVRHVPNGTAYLDVSARVDNDRVAEALPLLHAAVDPAQYDDDDARTAAAARALSLPLTYQTIGGRVSALHWGALYTHDPSEFWEAAGPSLAEVDASTFARLLEGCSTHRATTIVGPAADFTAQVEAQGMSVESVDWMNDALEELGRFDKPWAREARKARGL